MKRLFGICFVGLVVVMVIQADQAHALLIVSQVANFCVQAAIAIAHAILNA